MSDYTNEFMDFVRGKLEEMSKDYVKFESGKVTAPGTRIRKALLGISKKCKEERLRLQDARKAAKSE